MYQTTLEKSDTLGQNPRHLVELTWEYRRIAGAFFPAAWMSITIITTATHH
jgi:hypothetical protein